MDFLAMNVGVSLNGEDDITPTTCLKKASAQMEMSRGAAPSRNDDWYEDWVSNWGTES
jgi:hypothetical protein